MVGLTDERVRRQMAPFDHPQLFVPSGHKERSGMLLADQNGKAIDIIVTIPEVGAEGGAPLPTFLSP